jgi:GR25 family glycosyltransferase involved in LPS biosynthesis
MKTRKNKPMAVYWINLERSKERRENMVEILKDKTFDTMTKHRVEAIDGKKMTEQKLRSMFTIDLTKHTIIEYCCLLSHLKALKQFSKSDSTLALILEDDVCLDFKPYWQESIKDCIHNAPPDWELLQISYIVYDEFPKKMYTPYTQKYGGAFSYVVNKKGVLRFLKQFHLDENPHVADYVLFHQMKTFTYKYPFFVSTSKDSEIHKDHIEKYHLPSKKKLETYLSKQPFPLKQDILFVTAFKNIKRDQWKVNSRTIETYIKNFIILTKLPYTLVVYVEPEIKKQIPFLHNVIVRDFNEVSTFYDAFLEKDKQIMKSNSYQSKIPENRKIHPEHLYSEYNFINHSKINFVSHTKKIFPHYAFYSWVDFGFSGHLKNIPCPIDVSSLPKKIIYQTMNKPISISEEEMLTKDDVYFAGSAFVIHHSLVELFEQKWKKKIKEWQKRGITDDDQNLVLQLYLDDPSLFYTVYHKEWRMLYSLLTPSKKLCT